MAHLLPAPVWWTLVIVEPISVFAGAIYAIRFPEKFVAEQYPDSPIEVLNNSQLTATYELGLAYLILGCAAVAVFSSGRDIKVVNSFLWAFFVGDVGHFALMWYMLGTEKLVDVSSWNFLTTFTIGFTTFLMAVRGAYLLGLFGNKTAVGQHMK